MTGPAWPARGPADDGTGDGTGAAPAGDPVRDALAELDEVAPLSPAQQVPAFEAAHRALAQTLSAIDAT